MLVYTILLFSLMLLWMVVYNYNGKDVLRPSSVILLLQILSVLSAMIGKTTWNYNTGDLLCLTYCIVIFSSIAVVFGCRVANIKFTFRQKTLSIHKKSESIYQNEYFQIKKSYFFVLLTIEVVLFIIYYYFLSLTFNTKNISLLIYYGHEYYFWQSLVKNATAQTLAKYTFKLIKVIGYAFIYIFSYNFTIKCKGKIKLFIPIFIFLLGWVLGGSRHNAMLTVIAIVVLSYINALKYVRINKRKMRRKMLPIAIIFGVLILIFFLGLATFWATNNKSSLAYGSFTFGCPIPTMNEALKTKQGFDMRGSFGATTFSGLYKMLNRMGIINEYVKSTKGWIIFKDPSGVEFASNTFSAPYNLYFDFGFIGMMIFSFFEGFIYTKLYNRAMFASRKDYFSVVVFSYFITSMFNWFRTEDLFASNLIEISTYICIPLTILVIKYFFIRVKK